jgi:hypothetical protein
VIDLEAALADPLALPAEEVQRLLAAAVRVYAARAEAGVREPPFGPGAPTATEVAVTVSAMLAAARIELFELGMWQSWS